MTLRDKVRSCEIRRALNVEPLFLRIEKAQIYWFVRVSRIPHKRLAQVQLAEPIQKRFRGHPRPRWSDYISDLAWSRLGVELAELSEIALRYFKPS